MPIGETVEMAMVKGPPMDLANMRLLCLTRIDVYVAIKP
jgi:hypothetical protein